MVTPVLSIRCAPDASAAYTQLTANSIFPHAGVAGDHLYRSSDGPPGNTVMWRGMTRLTDIALGYELAGGSCG